MHVDDQGDAERRVEELGAVLAPLPSADARGNGLINVAVAEPRLRVHVLQAIGWGSTSLHWYCLQYCGVRGFHSGPWQLHFGLPNALCPFLRLAGSLGVTILSECMGHSS